MDLCRERVSGLQTLLVPRPTLHKQKPAEVQQIVEEHGEKYLAPQTPDRVAVQSTKSPLNSPQSMASPARPYAEVDSPRPSLSFLQLPTICFGLHCDVMTSRQTVSGIAFH